MKVIDILDDLAGDSSRLYKESVLRREIDNEDLREAFRLAYDSHTQFYIRRIPTYVRDGKKKLSTLKQAMLRLNLLTNRTLTGNAGLEHLSLVLASVDEADAEVIKRIIAKDLRCGINESTINKIWPGLVTEYPCMLASAYDQRLVDQVQFPAIAQLKLDGMRFNAIVRNGAVEFRSRNGKEVIIPDADFAQEFIRLGAAYAGDFVFDGELLVKSAGTVLDRKTGNGILNKGVKGTMSDAEAKLVHATLWDVIPYDSFVAGQHSMPYHLRLDILAKRLQSTRIDIAPTHTVATLEEARSIFEEYLTAGQEGIILKTRTGVWENKRSKSLIKFKGELECDLLCVGWEEGTGKNAGRLGALVLESGCGTVRVNVGTGFSDANRIAFTRANSIGRIVAVKYNSRITDKNSAVDSLFLPVFIEFRDDKDTADIAKDIK